MNDVKQAMIGAGYRPEGRVWKLLALLALGLSTLLNSGCRSTPKSKAHGFASVIINGNTPGQISAVAAEVFRAHGYKAAEVGRTALVFEKKGTSLSNLAYGSWLGDTPIWERVKVTIVPVAEMAFRLQCQAYRVQDKGGAIEEEVKIGSLHAHPYQKLLEEVAARFQPAAP
jgi:hypothetical protein